MGAYLTIGQVARQAGVNIQTIRYYERRKLLLPERRKESVYGLSHDGYRLYSNEAVKKILFIKRAQELGFTLKEIMGLLRLQVSNSARCGDVKKKAEAKLGNVQARISGLKAMERTLINLIGTCQARATTDRCPILKSLEFRKGSRAHIEHQGSQSRAKSRERVSLPKGGKKR